MKKKQIALAAIIVTMGIILAVAARDPAKSADALVVQGTTPFASEVFSMHSMTPNRLIRHYSLHMSYDDAVKAIEKEVKPKSWKENAFYSACHFNSPGGADGQWITVDRSRFYGFFTPAPGSKFSSLLAGIPSLPPTESPSGWVVITTSRPINPLSGLFEALRRTIASKARGGGAKSFYQSSPLPKIGNPDQPVDVSAGTMNLESTSTMTSNAILPN